MSFQLNSNWTVDRMIQRIELTNFMSHAHTVIEPAAGLTVLVGPNNCGKSAVMSALQILCHNDTSTYVTRHGEKECAIRVTTDDGHEIVWTRHKTTTKYVIDGQTHDRLRGKVPESLYDVLRLPKVTLEQSSDEFDIHFGNQKQPVFLLNESGRAAAGFFAASSDASRLIEMQKLHRQRVQNAKREQARLADQSSELEQQIETMAALPALQQQFDQSVDLQLEMDRQGAEVVRLRTLIERAKQLLGTRACLQEKFESMQPLSDPPKLAVTDRLRALSGEISTHRLSENYLQATSASLSELVMPPSEHATEALVEITEEIAKLQSLQKGIEQRSRLLSEPLLPPKTQPTNKLRSLIADVRRHANLIKSASKAAQISDQLSPPPAVSVPLSLQEFIRDGRELANQLAQLKIQMEPLAQQAKQLDKELETFSESNPICPTCNQPLSSKQILQRVKGPNHGG